jgi:hypothetical protein
MIPQRSVTKIAAVSLPESLFDYGFVDIAAHYTQKFFEQVGYSFDLRLCVKNTLPRDSVELQLLRVWETVLDRQKLNAIKLSPKFRPAGRPIPSRSLITKGKLTCPRARGGISLPAGLA